MRFALGQLNSIQGDLDHNRRAIEALALDAKKAGAQMLVLPELSLPGYSPKDLLYHDDFLAAVLAAEETFAARLPEDLAVFFGSLRRPSPASGKRLLNVAILAHGGQLRVVAAKRYLPNYDVFDEARYFVPGPASEVLDLMDLKIGVTICEDIWNGTTGDPGMPLYSGDPPTELVRAGAQVLINLSASPWHKGKGEGREALVTDLSKRLSTALILTNLVGGNDDVLFDGNSLATNARGEVIARASSFVEDLQTFELSDRALGPRRLDDIEEVRRALVRGIKDYTEKSGFRRLLLGLSGGIDSAVVAVLAAQALGPEAVTALGMPSRFSADDSLDDARELASALGISFRVLPIENVFKASLLELEPHFEGRAQDLTEENIQPRIRGLFLMALANKYQALLLATGNKSELAMGYCTLYGDMCGALAPISDLFKGEVYELAEHLNDNFGAPIPRRTIDRAPSAELRPEQKDSDSLPEYEILDAILRLLLIDRASRAELIAAGFEPQVVDDVMAGVSMNEYKRKQMPPGLKVSPKAFGAGRRMPITGGRLDRIDSAKGRE